MYLPPYKTFPEISNPAIKLRQLVAADLEHIVDISYYNAQPATTTQEAARMQASITHDYQTGTTVHWGIADVATQALVGTCGYYRGFEEDTGELGFVLKPACWGRGYMTAALKAAIDFGFNTMGLQKILAHTTRQNVKTIQLLTRLHFVKIADATPDEVTYELRRTP
ncbi:GNAT family N-acetyltransferase [Hymenobacter sp. HMF4947]|uniref:GNAT family N-acetyltransferase n=1 Tax=Hymenobacter ginkgonis TaxID=2682976 RepID=A0A7K1TB59_9BACT|nr:GNAT family N-acetyltransferase [Hymenobacter ginkgonis]MVN75637.1 GNAT family N-acetyltransferase [Hymenobacter ginkgonis]